MNFVQGLQASLHGYIATAWKAVSRLRGSRLTLALAGFLATIAASSIATPAAALLTPSTTTVTATPNPVPAGQTVTLTATVTGSGGTPTGAIVFLSGTLQLGVVNLSNGMASFSTSSLLLGSNTIIAVYSGDLNFLPSTSTNLTVIVQQTVSSSTTLTATPNPAAAGIPIAFTVSVTATGLVPTGTVALLDGATTIGTIPLVNGHGTFSTSSLGAGAHSITAAYGGASGVAASTSAAVAVVVNADNTTTTLTATPNPAALGQTVTFTASVTGGTSPTGTVIFKDGATALGSASLSGGKAMFSIASLGAGNHSITAVYGGDANNVGSTSSAVSVNIAASTLSASSFSVAVPFSVATTINLSGHVSGGATSVVITAQPSHGQISVNGLNVTYTPTRGYSGPDSFNFAAVGQGSMSSPAVVSIVVGTRPDPTQNADVTGLVSAQVQALQRFGEAQIDNVNTRLEHLHDDTIEPVSIGTSFTQNDTPASMTALDQLRQTQPGSAYADDPLLGPGQQAINGAAPAKSPNGEPGLRKEAPLSFWTGGTLTIGHQNPNGTTDTHFNTGGVTLGVDAKLIEGLRAGIAFGVGFDSSQVGTDGTKSDGNMVSGTVYATYRLLPKTFLDVLAGYGRGTFDAQRLAPDSTFVFGRRGASDAYGSISLTQEMNSGAWKFAPYTRLDVIHIGLNSFTENGPDIFALNYTGLDATSYSVSWARASAIRSWKSGAC
jgi:hypothetical protein